MSARQRWTALVMLVGGLLVVMMDMTILITSRHKTLRPARLRSVPHLLGADVTVTTRDAARLPVRTRPGDGDKPGIGGGDEDTGWS